MFFFFSFFCSLHRPPPGTRRAAPSAEFSVDRTRHLMSFLTMLGPSPDWNVGLSGEDLCTKDCGWVQRLVTDLIPWDAGTDNGVTYEVIYPVFTGWFKCTLAVVETWRGVTSRRGLKLCHNLSPSWRTTEELAVME